MQKTKFTSIEKSNLNFGCIDNIGVVDKQKFPKELAPASRPSRKGYLRTRWRLKSAPENSVSSTSGGIDKARSIPVEPLTSYSTFDLVNIHLFHDADNIESFKSFPSKFACCRQKALDYTIQRILNNDTTSNVSDCVVPFFIFGDFNFRLNSKKVIDNLVLNTGKRTDINTTSVTKGCDNTNVEYTFQDSGEELMIYKNKLSDEVILSVGAKEFNLPTSTKIDETFGKHWLAWKECDFETNFIEKVLTEFPLSFPPTYPFEENLDLGDIGESYMKKRCPAWCDRVLISKLASDNLLQHITGVQNMESKAEFGTESHLKPNMFEDIQYDVIGSNVCMGDHKPVFLKLRLQHGADVLGSYSQNSIHSGSPEKFPRIESPTYIDLLNDTEMNAKMTGVITMEDGKLSRIETGLVPHKSVDTSSSESTSAIKNINAKYSFKETTV